MSSIATLISKRLTLAALIFDRPMSPEELLVLSRAFTEILSGEDPRAIAAAFDAQLRESRRFPVPADIIDRLPACRAALSAAAAQPESDDTTHTPGYPSFLAARRRGDDEALAALEQEYGREAMQRFESLLAGAVAACNVRQ